ncbi:oxidoreductase C-terminal domain-containing protein, partial [Burkholderia cenocepacia]|uniref:oxidoreductase C-terminal domain-containing protein n=1 Tax=Burkholderia cenocepacia TaxID=95486 RepID=UPI0024B721CD
AQNQAIAAAKAVLGVRAPYAEIPGCWAVQEDGTMQILGDLRDDGQVVVRGDVAARRATLFFVGDGHVRGVIAVNNARELKLARKWMNQGRAVDTEALADTTQALA